MCLWTNLLLGSVRSVRSERTERTNSIEEKLLYLLRVAFVYNAVWRKRLSRQAHNLKIVGSNPTAANHVPWVGALPRKKNQKTYSKFSLTALRF